MSTSSFVHRLFVLATVLGFPGVAGQAWGQSVSSLVTDPGSITLEVAFSAATGMGTLADVDSDTAAVNGTALVSLFPTDPPFTHCTIHSLSLAVGTIELHYRVFFNIIELDATFTDLVIESTAPFNGTIDPAGNIQFATTPLRVIGDVHMVSPGLGIDMTMAIEALSSDPIAMRLSETAGEVTLSDIYIPTVEWTVPPELLPDAIYSLHVTVNNDVSGVVFRGDYEPGIPGDGNADGLVNLGDFPSFIDCLTGPGGVAGLFCDAFLFDEDDDVDLFDLAEFQTAATGW